MITKAYVVTDLGPGDGGKGGVVEAISAKVRPRAIIKEGGAQGSHGVVLADGRKFCFSQWGCGTFQGVPTYLSPRFVMSPLGLLNEAAALEKGEFGISAFDLLSVSPNCVCASPYHQVWSRLYELSLRDHPHGTVGTGVGKAYQQSQTNDELTLFARDLTDYDKIRLVLGRQRDFVRDKFGKLSEADILEADIPILHDCLAGLENDDEFNYIVDATRYVGCLVLLEEYESLLKKEGCVVVERSHGILTDAEYGFKPHVSSLRTLPRFSFQSLRSAGFTGKIVNLGVHRAYEIRHGAGPMPTASELAASRLLPNSCKNTNRWQGKVRVGALDAVLLNYAIRLCGKDVPLDGLCITWFDQILANGSWPICSAYVVDGERVEPGVSPDLNMLDIAEPAITEYDVLSQVPDIKDRDRAYKFCRNTLATVTDVPVRLLSFGACKEDKYFI